MINNLSAMETTDIYQDTELQTKFQQLHELSVYTDVEELENILHKLFDNTIIETKQEFKTIADQLILKVDEYVHNIYEMRQYIANTPTVNLEYENSLINNPFLEEYYESIQHFNKTADVIENYIRKIYNDNISQYSKELEDMFNNLSSIGDLKHVLSNIENGCVYIDTDVNFIKAFLIEKGIGFYNTTNYAHKLIIDTIVNIDHSYFEKTLYLTEISSLENSTALVDQLSSIANKLQDLENIIIKRRKNRFTNNKMYYNWIITIVLSLIHKHYWTILIGIIMM